MKSTRFRIMLISGTPPRRGSAGTGRRARLRTACRKAWGFESPLPHHTIVNTSKILPPPLLKYQPGHAWPAGFLLASPIAGRGYNVVTDDAKDPLANHVPLTLPESMVGVAR